MMGFMPRLYLVKCKVKRDYALPETRELMRNRRILDETRLRWELGWTHDLADSSPERYIGTPGPLFTKW